MEGAFTHLGNHLVSNSASTIAAGDDESILDGHFGRLPAPTRRPRQQDDDDETDVFDDEDMESMASMTVDGANGKGVSKIEELVELPAHACS
jgi:regulator of nonsense transcripts 1